MPANVYDSGLAFDTHYQRPLPPRQKSFYVGGSFGSGLGLDLVTPHCVLPAGNGVSVASVQPKVAEGIDCSGIFWEKRAVASVPAEKKLGPGAEGLGKLLREAE